MTQSSSTAHEAWATTAPTYSSNVGRTSAMAAAHLVALAAKTRPFDPSSYALDNGAGTGAVTLALASRYPDLNVLATDTSASMLENISNQKLPRVKTLVQDARTLSQTVQCEAFSHVFSTFMLQTITTPLEAVRQMYNLLQPGGVIGLALWGRRNGPFEVWERACQRLDPAYRLPQAPFDDPNAWRTREELDTALKEAGFHDTKTEEVIMPFEFKSAEAFKDFWFGAKNPAAEKCMSNFTGDMASAKAAVGDVVEQEYSDGKDIKIWAVLGVAIK